MLWRHGATTPMTAARRIEYINYETCDIFWELSSSDNISRINYNYFWPGLLLKIKREAGPLSGKLNYYN